jgi:hypothetical protein
MLLLITSQDLDRLGIIVKLSGVGCESQDQVLVSGLESYTQRGINRECMYCHLEGGPCSPRSFEEVQCKCVCYACVHCLYLSH